MGRAQHSEALLAAIKAHLSELSELLDKVNDEWNYEDGVYRFYHHSFKVYRLQDLTKEIVAALEPLLPDRDLCPLFVEIVREGTGKKFHISHNENWSMHTRPMVEAFLHARFFLEMAVRYGRELDEAPQLLPCGWAAVLSLYRPRRKPRTPPPADS